MKRFCVTGVCSFHTLTVGFMLDHHIPLVEDSCATTYGSQAHNEAVALAKRHYGHVTASKDIIDRWARMSRASAATPVETAKQVLQ